MIKEIQDCTKIEEGLFNVFEVSGAQDTVHHLGFLADAKRRTLLETNYHKDANGLDSIKFSFGREKAPVTEYLDDKCVMTVINCMNAYHPGGARAHLDPKGGTQEEELYNKLELAYLPFHGSVRSFMKRGLPAFTPDNRVYIGGYFYGRGEYIHQHHSPFVNAPASFLGPMVWAQGRGGKVFADRPNLQVVYIHAPDFRENNSRGRINRANLASKHSATHLAEMTQMVRYQLASVIEAHIRKCGKGVRNKLVMPILGCGAFQGNSAWYAQQYAVVLNHYSKSLTDLGTEVFFPWTIRTDGSAGIFKKHFEKLVRGESLGSQYPFYQKSMPVVPGLDPSYIAPQGAILADYFADTLDAKGFRYPVLDTECGHANELYKQQRAAGVVGELRDNHIDYGATSKPDSKIVDDRSWLLRLWHAIKFFIKSLFGGGSMSSQTRAWLSKHKKSGSLGSGSAVAASYKVEGKDSDYSGAPKPGVKR